MEKWRIMVVDDEEDIRQLLSATLSSEHEVVTAHDGLDALEKLKRYEPDFIIMDVMMPLMNGLDASMAVRENPEFNHVPILFLSALSTREDMQKAYRSGADLYLTKPIEPAHLLSTINSFLEKNPYDPRKKKLSMREIEKMESAGRIAEPEVKIKKPDGTPEKPQKKPSEFEEIASRQPLPKHRPGPYDISSYDIAPRLMTVDDDTDMLDFIRLSMMEQFEFVSATDGLQAIKKLVLYQPDMFILDVTLPKMSGYQLCQSIRRNRTFKNTPILMVSGKSKPKEIQYALRMGADAYLTKPFSTQDLIDKLQEVMGRRKLKIREKKLSIKDIEERETEEKNTFEAKEGKFIKRREESEIQKFLRKQIQEEEKNTGK